MLGKWCSLSEMVLKDKKRKCFKPLTLVFNISVIYWLHREIWNMNSNRKTKAGGVLLSRSQSEYSLIDLFMSKPSLVGLWARTFRKSCESCFVNHHSVTFLTLSLLCAKIAKFYTLFGCWSVFQIQFITFTLIVMISSGDFKDFELMFFDGKCWTESFWKL